MLTTKQTARDIFVTYCSTTNTMFEHTSKVKPKNVAATTAHAVFKNVAKAEVARFFALPSLYLLRKKV